MKKHAASLLLSVVLVVVSGPLSAQSPNDDYHPFMSDTFNLGLGIYYPQKDLKLRVDGSVQELDFDFDQALKLDENETTANLTFRWRFGEKWSLFGQYWTIGSNGGAVLEEDIEWQDVVFREGTFVEGGFDLDIARVFLGRNFYTRPGHEFGAGIGLHWMELGANLRGQILTSEGDSEFYRGSVSAGIPLPNIGAWYYWSWSPKWVFSARLDWLSASIGDYSGGMWNGNVGVNWQFSKHLGAGLYYQSFVLDVDVDKSNWHGSAKVSQRGPMFAITATW